MAKHKASDAKRAFENKAGVEFRSGGELNGWLWDADKKLARITIPKGRKEIPVGTFNSMAKHLYINTCQLSEFISCTIGGQELIKIIKSNITEI